MSFTMDMTHVSIILYYNVTGVPAVMLIVIDVGCMQYVVYTHFKIVISFGDLI